MGVLRDRAEAREEAYEIFAQEKRKQDEQVRANMRRLKELRTTYAIAEHQPDRLNT
jgi:hypothetical protein